MKFASSLSVSCHDGRFHRLPTKLDAKYWGVSVKSPINHRSFRPVVIQFVVHQQHIKNKATKTIQMRRRRLIVQFVMDLNQEGGGGEGEGVQSQILKKNRSKYLFLKKSMPNS